MAIYQSMYKGAQMDAADTLSLNPDATPTENSTNLVTSGGVFSALGSAQNASAPAILNTASGAVCSFADGSASPMASVVAEIVASQAGSGDPAPDNIRPISGFTGANVTRAGRNMLVPIVSGGSITWNGVTLSAQNGELYLNGTASASGGRTTLKTSNFTLPRGTYTISCSKTQLIIHNASDNSIIANTLGVATFTLDQPTAVYAGFNVIANQSYSGALDAQIEIGSTAHDYEPYAGEVFSVSWADTAGIVYNGQVDIVSGVLTAAYAKVTFDGSQEVGLTNWQPNASSVGWLYAPNKTPNILNEVLTDLNLDNIACDTLKVVKYGSSSGLYGETIPCVSCVGSGAWGIGMRMTDTSLTTNASINAWLSANPITVVYKLATPQTYQLTPQEVASLLGDNTLWNDVGGDTSAEYRADTKLYIQSLLGA